MAGFGAIRLLTGMKSMSTVIMHILVSRLLCKANFTSSGSFPIRALLGQSQRMMKRVRSVALSSSQTTQIRITLRVTHGRNVGSVSNGRLPTRPVRYFFLGERHCA